MLTKDTKDSLFQPIQNAGVIILDYLYRLQRNHGVLVELPRYLSVPSVSSLSISDPALSSYDLPASVCEKTTPSLFLPEEIHRADDCIAFFSRKKTECVHLTPSFRVDYLALPFVPSLSATQHISYTVAPPPRRTVPPQRSFVRPEEILLFATHKRHYIQQVPALSPQPLPSLDSTFHSSKLHQLRQEVSQYTDLLNTHAFLPVPMVGKASIFHFSDRRIVIECVVPLTPYNNCMIDVFKTLLISPYCR